MSQVFASDKNLIIKMELLDPYVILLAQIYSY